MEELIKLIYRHKQLRKIAWDVDSEACPYSREKHNIEDKMYELAKKLKKEMVEKKAFIESHRKKNNVRVEIDEFADYLRFKNQ